MPTWRLLQYIAILAQFTNCQKTAVPESNFTQAFFASASAPIAQPFVPDMSGYGDQGHEVVPYGAGAVDHEHQHPRCAHQELALSFSTMRSFGKRTCSFYEALQARRVPLPLNSESEKKTKTESSCRVDPNFRHVSLLDPLGSEMA